MFRVELPWPRDACSQNARVSYRDKAKAVKADRGDAFYACKEARFPAIAAERVAVRVTISKRNSQIDDQNAIGWCKAQLDGVADAIGVDDNRWDVTWAFAAPSKGGAIIVEVQP